MTKLSALTNSFILEYADFQTTWALSVGLKGFEGRVSDLSEARIRRHRAFLRRLDKELQAMPTLKPGSQAWLELELLKSEIRLRFYDWEIGGKYTLNPTIYTEELIYGLWFILLRVEEKGLRVQACLDRLRDSKEIPVVARQNLRHPPKLWTHIALGELAGYLHFLQEVKTELLRLAPKRSKEIQDAIHGAVRVGKEFQQFLKGPLLRKSKGDYGVGEAAFNFLLRTYHHYDLNASALLRLGIKYLDEIRLELEEHARRLDRATPWAEQVRHYKKNHPSAGRLMATYRREVKQLKNFLKRKKLVSIPAGESLQIIETPVFSRSTIPYAAYIDPPMFSGKNRGTFFVTPVDSRNKKISREVLEEHNRGSLKITALHEGYPGHHLQFAHQKTASGKLMRIYNCSSFYEGWALYCEEMMYEEGYFDGPARLLQLRDKLWRACRVVIDVGLHTHSLTDAQAVKFLIKELKMSPSSARADVNWYTMRPTVPQSYLTGKLRIVHLRDKYQKKLGAKYSLKKFHDDLLKFGAIPIPLVEKMLLGP